MSNNGNKTVTLTVDVQAKLNDLQGQVKKMQDILGNLKMPESLTQGSARAFNEIAEKVKKLQEYTEGNKLKLVDERKVQSEINSIQKDFKHLVDRINAQSSKIKIGDNKSADALRKGINDYKKTINESTTAIEKQEGELAKLEGRLKKLQDAVDTRKQWKENAEAAIEAAQERIKKTEAAEAAYRAKRQKEGWDEDKINTNFKRTNDYKERLKAIQEEAEQKELLKKRTTELKNAEDALNTKGADFKNAIANQRAEVDRLKKSLGEVSKEELQNLKDNLSALQGTNGIKFDFDPQSIQTLEEFEQKLEEIDGQDLQHVNTALKQFESIATDCRSRLEQLDQEVEDNANSFKNLDNSLEQFKKKAAYFFGITNAVNLFKRAVQSAFNTVKDLDAVMTETAVVTDFSVGDMWAQLPEYTKRANELGVSIHDAYEAATLYYQQGLKTNEVIAVSNETLKMARIAGLGAAEATDRMTNALRGFNMEINEESAQRVNDVYSKLAAITAADTDEISTAMTKVASLAHNANMEFETTSAFLSQMIETTRESAETAGTALKTVIARFSEVKKLYNQGDLMGKDEEGEDIDVNKVSQALRSAGINLNEYLTGAKGLDDIFIELAGKWEHLDMVQQRYIATMAAGSRQQSRFIAMMSDYDRTMQLVNAANTSAGASQKQFEKTLDSLQSKLAQLKNSWDTFLMGLADDKIIKGIIDIITELINLINRLFELTDKIPVGGALVRLAALAVAFIGLKKGITGVTVALQRNFTQMALNTAAETAYSAAIAQGKTVEEAEAIRKNMLTAATNNNTKATILNTLAKKKDILATKVAALSTLQFIAVTAAASAAILLVSFAVYKVVKWFQNWKNSSPEKVLERAEESAENAAKATNELAESYNNLKDSLTGLDDKYEALEKMTRGTQEWRDAVQEINNEVLDLMANYDNVQIKNENGVLKVANPDEVRNATSQRYASAQAAQIGAQQEVARAKLQVDYKNALKEFADSWTADILAREGGDVQDRYGQIAKKLASGEFTGSDEEIKSQIRAEWERTLGSEIDVTDDVVQSLRDYGKALNTSESKISAYNDSLAAVAVSNANLTKGTEQQSQNFMNGNRMDSFYIQEYNKMVGQSYKDIKNSLAQELGYKDYSAYKSENGEIDDESARVQLAQINAQKEATKSVEIFSRSLRKLPDYVQKMYTRADGMGLTKSDVEKARNGFSLEQARKDDQNQVMEYEGQEYRGKAAEAMKLIQGADEAWKKLSDDEKAAYGNIEDFRKEYSLSVIHTLEAFDKAGQKFNELGLSADAFSEKLSAGALSDLGDNLRLIFQVSGKEAAQGIEKQISDITDNLSTEKAEEFINTLNSIDWTNADALDRLESTLDGLGIEVPDEQIEKLTKDLIECGNATRKIDLENVTEQLEKMIGLAAKIRSGEQGRTGFTKENVEDLVAAGMERSDFQFDPFSGSWSYIGDSLNTIIEKIDEQTGKMVGAEEVRKEIANGKIFDETKESRSVDTDSAASLRSFLGAYIANGGTGVSEDLLKGPERANNESDYEYSKRQQAYFDNLLPELQEAYYRLTEYSASVDKNTEALDQLIKQEEISNQIMQNDILTNAALGNTEAVKTQAAASGAPEEMLKDLNGDINGLAKIGDVYNKAGEAGIDKAELTDYAKQLKKVNKELTNVGAAQTALANTRQTKGFDDLVESYEEWSKLLDEDGHLLTDLDADQAKTLSDMKQGVNNLLNTTEDLPDAFYDSEENMLLLKKAVEEGGEAIYDLKAAALDSIVIDAEVNYDGMDQDMAMLKDFILNEAPTLEVGTELNDKPFITALNNLLANSKLTAQQVNSILGSMGVNMTLKPKYGTIELPFGGQSAPGNGVSGYEYAKAYSAAKQKAIIGWEWVPGTQTTYTGNVSSGGVKAKSSGGGGSSKSEKNDTWENPYDELYNLTEKINESLRTREALERRYEKLVKKTASTVGEVTKAYYDQIRQLRTEADLQYQMQAGRARQLNNVGNEYYMDSEGNRSTFNALGVTKYASYDQKTGLLQIDWSGLEALEGDPNKVEEGKAAEAYISRLEELQDQFEEVRDKLWDIEDQIEELREEAIENYLTFEDRVMDALVDSYQRQIDEYTSLSDEIKEQTDAILKGVQEDVALSRQIRDNTKKEEDIADKEARLAYLRRDTSGANALEIKKLEEEIANSRESYSDTLVDQQLTQLQDDANSAAEQRQHQIEIMQHQLDIAKETGTLWGEVWDLINTATAADGTFSQNSELAILLEETEAFQSLSKIGQMKWWDEVAEAFKRAQVGLSEAEDKYGVDANGDGKVTSSGTSAAIADTASKSSTPATGGSATTTTKTSTVSTAGAGHFAKVNAYEHPMAQMPASEVKELQQALNDAGFTDNDGKKLVVDGKYGTRTKAAVSKLQQKLGDVKVDGYYGPKTRASTLKSQFKAYKTGGLADYTGPAWLDGSKAHPELVLNSKDTENFIELKNILANSMGAQGAGGINGGDTYYEFNIDAELGSDYDVEKLADKIKRMIYNDSSYRNVNSINFTR